MDEKFGLEYLTLSEFEINHAHLTCTDRTSGKEVPFVGIEADLNRNASAKEVMQWFNLEKGAMKTNQSVRIAS